METNIIPGVRALTPPEPRGGRQILDQTDFLALMTAQLKNQDPTKPVDNTEYVAQMAQFSMVAGVSETNTRLADVIARLDALIATQNPATQPQE
jgi:flagellar basal-body rod modification protein FlgD